MRHLVPLALLSVESGSLGYLALGLLVGIESAGIPVPGETALITAAVLASTGKLEIELVIAVAAGAAIIGDNIGYVLGRRFGRGLLVREGRGEARRLAVLVAGEGLFDRHGPKAVFFGRWIAGLRIWAAWLAGITRMHWRSFLFWNALGGICWATFFGLLGYFAGKATAELIGRVGTFAAIGIIAILALVLFVLYRRGRLGRLLHPVGLEAGEELVLARRAFDAMSGGDLDRLREVLGPEAELTSQPPLPATGDYRGAEGWRRYFQEWEASWDETTVKLERLLRREGRVIARTLHRVRRPDASEPHEVRVLQEFVIQDGRVVESRIYVEEE